MKIWYNGVPVTKATGIKNLDGHIGIQGEKNLLEFRAEEVTRLQAESVRYQTTP